MIINDTFMWLYAAYKFGNVCIALACASVILCLIALPIADAGEERGKTIAKIIWIASLFVLPITISIACITPGAAELKAYAAYAIGKDVVNSDESKELLEAATKFLEGETKNKD